MENVKIQNALQNIYNQLETSKESIDKGYKEAPVFEINNALSSLMEITEELNIEITI